MNTAALLTKAARAYGDRTALRYGGEILTYRELDERVSRFASALRARDFERGDRVALYMKNHPDYVVAVFGCFRAGLCVVPTNAKLHEREVEWIAGNAEVRLLLRAPEEIAAIVAEGEPGFRDEEVEPTDLAWLFYTSGTTGFPKGAMLSHRNLVSMTVNCLADVLPFQPEHVVLHPAPLSHACGLYLLAAVARGCDNLIYDRPSFEPAELLATVERERVNVIPFLAPTMIVMLLDAPGGHDTSSLEHVLYGGAPIHVDHLREALRRFGPIFVQVYGQGESPMTITALRREDHLVGDDAVLASAGLPRTDVEVRVVDEDGTEVPVGEEGEVVVRGDVVMSGYWRNPEATAKSLRNGWLHTGDIGRFDEAGRLSLLDRKNDMIISGGTNIYPREVEEVLVQHPAVREACVFGVPDRIWGESVVACVVPAAGAEPASDELIEFCKEHLASFKKPKRVELIDALPKNAYGKVLRRELRERYREDVAPA